MIAAGADEAYARARDGREAALREARRRLILDGAWTVFAEHGLDGATMREIAAASGCTTGAIYPLFASKEAIYGALLGDSLQRLHAAVAAAEEQVRQDRAACLRAGALAFLRYYRDRPEEVALGLYLWRGVRPQGLTPELDAELNRLLAATLGLLQEGIARLGRLAADAARTEAAALFAFLIGALVAHQTGRLRTLGSDLDAVAALHMDVLAARLARDAGTRGSGP